MSPAVEKELCFAKFHDTFVQSFLHRGDVIPPVPPTSLEEGGDGSAEQKTCNDDRSQGMQNIFTQGTAKTLIFEYK